MTPRLAKAIEIAMAGGRSTLAHYQRGFEVELKGDASPVTVADKGAEALMRGMIDDFFPGEAILGEEEGMTGVGDDRWVLDPIDGTKSFVSGVPLYGTLVAYEQAGVPILGVVYFPALDELFYAERGGGAFWGERRISVIDPVDLDRAVVCSGSLNSLAKFGRLAGMMRLAESTMAHRTWGDAYGHMLVASGRVAGMFDPVVARWDVSAVIPIVEEAGGICMGFDGSSVLGSGRSDHALELVSVAPGLRDLTLECFV
jgi:histidinol phosphatase-like enzyme (inositol monophosphatase family)